MTKLSNDWYQANKARIAEICAGTAGVFDSKLLALYKPIVARVTTNRMGCSGAAFATEAEARQWLRG